MDTYTAEDIKSLRESLKLSRAAFAERLGVSHVHVHYLERGERVPSNTLCLLLNCVEKEFKRKGDKR